MRVCHNTREAAYRSPFGAITVGATVHLAIDIWEELTPCVSLRIWIDGKGETLIDMEKTNEFTGCSRFTVAVTPEESELFWYSFLITKSDGTKVWYGAKVNHTGGEGAIYDGPPPSFQITVNKERKVPDWYKKGIVYQIFPDRFCRGSNWNELKENAMAAHKKGPKRNICEDWDKIPTYNRDANGRIASWEFYGGTLSGIEDKMSYLQELGITAIYLNPIFEAASNHRYDTGDFTKLDPLLGNEGEFEQFCKKAERYGISIILDGVFNHTGCDSKYFNKYENYNSIGAWKNEKSPYRDWYRFKEDGESYDCWWGVDDLPTVNKEEESYIEFIYANKDSIVRRWLQAGAKGWRLDVADELSDEFIAGIKDAIIKEKGKEGLLLGEVWEDASNKISYDKLRRYLLGQELDAAMNYPLRDGIEEYVLGHISSEELYERIMSLYENYPKEAFYSSLNLLGSHDRIRVLTLLGEAPNEGELSDEEKANYHLSEEQRNLAKSRLWLLVLMQMTMPGVPCIYYGDEVGMEGYSDPYNRGGYPWGKEDEDVRTIHRNAISLRKLYPLFVEGEFEPFYQNEDIFGFFRIKGKERAAVVVNRSRSSSHEVKIPSYGKAVEIISGLPLGEEDGQVIVSLYPLGSAIVYFQEEKNLSMEVERGSGVLCHITSLPNEEGKGCFGQPALQFVDFLEQAKQKYWQILPLNPTDAFGSPYAGSSAFAGNLSLTGYTKEQLTKLFESFQPDKKYIAFQKENKTWLRPYAMFSALKEKFSGENHQSWPVKYRNYKESLYEEKELAKRAEFYQFCQYMFDVKWQEVKTYANKKNIKIIGDMPMYVSADSADVWANPELFLLDEEGNPTEVAGVPPDYFAKEGQLWNNPIYNWANMKESEYAWWLSRLERAFYLYDYVRLDHFRGFEAYWSVPAGKKATYGRWVSAPGVDLFETAYAKFGPLPLVAEDLGIITPGVRALRAKCGFYGADVMQFYNGELLDGYETAEDKLAYPGTHDNATLVGWCQERYPEKDPHEMSKELLVKLFACTAGVVITPFQDILGLGDEARMNTPGTVEGNWMWQAKNVDFESAAKELEELTIHAKR